MSKLELPSARPVSIEIAQRRDHVDLLGEIALARLHHDVVKVDGIGGLARFEPSHHRLDLLGIEQFYVVGIKLVGIL